MAASRLERMLRENIDVAVELRCDGKEGYLYRPRQLLIDAADAKRRDVQNLLKRLGASSVDRWRGATRLQQDARLVRKPPRCGSDDFRELGLVVQYLPPSVSIPSLVGYFRSDSFGPSDRWPDCGVNHVFFGEQAYTGDPADNPIPKLQLPSPRFHIASGGRGVSVGILDTGVDVAAAAQHPTLAGHFVIEPGDVDVLDGDGSGMLDRQAGHGTFVAGVLMQRAPDAHFDPQAVLDTDGIGDDGTVSLALAAMAKQHQIVNMSLGGYTAGDLVPIGLNRVLSSLDLKKVVIVAAAGNNASEQLFWPAADERVLAVAAIDRKGNPAKFSNRGPWVDACAVGVKVTSTFVVGDWDPASMHPPSAVAPTFLKPFATWSGTSFAAPLVAGAIADRMSATGESARAAADALLQAAPPGPGPEFGKQIN